MITEFSFCMIRKIFGDIFSLRLSRFAGDSQCTLRKQLSECRIIVNHEDQSKVIIFFLIIYILAVLPFGFIRSSSNTHSSDVMIWWHILNKEHGLRIKANFHAIF